MSKALPPCEAPRLPGTGRDGTGEGACGTVGGDGGGRRAVEPQERARRLSGGVTHGGRVLQLATGEGGIHENRKWLSSPWKKIVSTDGHAID
jgi:hypothetical protein